MSKPCNFFFQNGNKTQIFTIIKPNIMKKSKLKHQQSRRKNTIPTKNINGSIQHKVQMPYQMLENTPCIC